MWLGVVGINEVGWMGGGFVTIGGTLAGHGPKNNIASDFVQLTTLASFHFFLFFVHWALPL
jgi:hypothetical protein